MSIERIERSLRLSQAVAYSNLVFLTGQVGDGAGTIEEQTRSVLASIDRLLELAGSSKTSILQATIWLADRLEFAGMNSIWDAWVDPENPPARSTGQLALLDPGFKLEITIVAARTSE